MTYKGNVVEVGRELNDPKTYKAGFRPGGYIRLQKPGRKTITHKLWLTEEQLSAALDAHIAGEEFEVIYLEVL